MKNYGPLPFQFSFFTEMLDLSPILRSVYIHYTMLCLSCHIISIPFCRYLNGPISELPEDKVSNSDEEDDGYDEDNDSYDRKRYQPRIDTSEATTGRTKLQQRFQQLSCALCEVVDDFGLVSFLPMNIEDVETVGRVLAATDKANGYSLAEFYREKQQIQEKKEQELRGESILKEGERKVTNSKMNEEATPSSKAKRYFQYASDQMDSLFLLSMEVQERYGNNS
jgi:hypothetical protein